MNYKKINSFEYIIRRIRLIKNEDIQIIFLKNIIEKSKAVYNIDRRVPYTPYYFTYYKVLNRYNVTYEGLDMLNEIIYN